MADMPELYDMVDDYFDSFKYLEPDHNGFSVFRITGNDVQNDDSFVDVVIYTFQGVKPFIIEINKV